MAMNFLTQAEEAVMLKLWRLEKATVKEILEEYPDPKPAYNTTSTIVRILEKKKMVKHKKNGKSFIYQPKISKVDYFKSLLDHFSKYYNDVPLEELYSEMTAKRTVQDLFQ